MAEELRGSEEPPFELQMEVRKAAIAAEEAGSNLSAKKAAVKSFLTRMGELEPRFPSHRRYLRRYGLAYASGIAERSGLLRQARELLGRALRQRGFSAEELAVYYCSQSTICMKLGDAKAARRAAYRGLAYGMRCGGLPLQNLVGLLDQYGWGLKLNLAELARAQMRRQSKG